MYSKDTKLVTSCFSTLQHLLYIEHFHSSINAATKDYENNLKKKRNNQQQFCVRRVFFILITKYMCILMLYNKRIGHTKNTIKFCALPPRLASSSIWANEAFLPFVAQFQVRLSLYVRFIGIFKSGLNRCDINFLVIYNRSC